MSEHSPSDRAGSLRDEVDHARTALLAGVDEMNPRLASLLQDEADHLLRIFNNGRNADSTVRYMISQLDQIRSSAIEFDRVSAGLHDDLESLGLRVGMLHELRDAGSAGRRAVPCLMKWFDKGPESLRLAVLDSLGPWAFPDVNSLLFDRFHRLSVGEDTTTLRRMILGTMASFATEVDLANWVDIIKDPRQADVRQEATDALSRISVPSTELIELALELTKDTDYLVSTKAAEMLARWRVTEALPVVEGLRSRLIEADVRDEDFGFVSDRLAKAEAALSRSHNQT